MMQDPSAQPALALAAATNGAGDSAPPRRAHARGDRRDQWERAVREYGAWPDDAAAARALYWIQSVVRRSDDEYLQRHPLEAVPGHVAACLAAVHVRAPQAILVGCKVPETARDGYEMPLVVLETCMADQPFIVDTIKMVLRRMKVRTVGTMNMILPVQRDESGALVALQPDNPAASNESFTGHLLTRGSVEGRLDALRAAIAGHLERTQRVVSDHRAMRKLVRDVNADLTDCVEAMPARAAELQQVVAFGEWLMADHFVFMGAYGFDEHGRPKGRLGLGRYDVGSRVGVETDPAEAFSGPAPLISILQSRLDAPVHRDARMQEIRIRLFGDNGEPAGGVVYQGLFTYAALTAPASEVPVLAHRLQRMMVAEDLVPRSHRMKVFLSFFDRLPLSFTLAASDEEIRSLIQEAIDVDFGGEARVHALVAPSGAVAHVFVMVAADRLATSCAGRSKRRFSAPTAATTWRFVCSPARPRRRCGITCCRPPSSSTPSTSTLCRAESRPWSARGKSACVSCCTTPASRRPRLTRSACALATASATTTGSGCKPATSRRTCAASPLCSTRASRA